ncbi:MAG: hypothetical protein K8W52_23445 [Deltaproteobacteria bacterium]|nr:hypothetical protein [Deltaproteobacteria bacterium]
MAADASTPPRPSPVAPLPAAALTVVGIGASAGGLSALEALVARLPEGPLAAIVLQHHGPEHGSMLAEILTRAARRPVETAVDGARVRPGAIYVIPGGVDASVAGGAFRIAPTTDRIPRESIDQLFTSLAADVGPQAIGVVLSGVGHDGTAGLRAIKAAGGLTFAQDPATAEQPGMPESALAAGCADLALAPAQIGDALRRLGQRSLAIGAAHTPHVDEPTLARILQALHAAHGVDFATYKTATIERRIARRMALRLIDRVEEYVELLGSRPDEVAGLYADLLIGVTEFFRDGEPFELLKTAVFPRLLRGGELPIRIWVPGCSTGEEAYSVAMSLCRPTGSPATSRATIAATRSSGRCARCWCSRATTSARTRRSRGSIW